jgi:hypothetical protein
VSQAHVVLADCLGARDGTLYRALGQAGVVCGVFGEALRTKVAILASFALAAAGLTWSGALLRLRVLALVDRLSPCQGISYLGWAQFVAAQVLVDFDKLALLMLQTDEPQRS